MKVCDILGVKTYCDLLHIIRGSRPPNPWIYAPGLTSVTQCTTHQLPVSFRQPCINQSARDDDLTVSNSSSTCLPLSPSITHSLFHSRLKLTFSQFFHRSNQWLKWFCEAGCSPDEAMLEQIPYPFHAQLIWWRYLGLK